MKSILFSLSVINFLSFLGAVHVFAERPNILWITSEDNGPYLGCYGDRTARTPNLDELAKISSRYTNCFSNAAVCAPARQTLISGMYASSLGGQHMRSKAEFPDHVALFPKYLKEAGYYTSNNSKTDYNGGPADAKVAMTEAWDESGNKGHWRNRPDKQTPFFSVFNFTDSHESKLFPSRWKKRKLITDPAIVDLPAYLPDTPETRLDMARYYDCLEQMDKKVGGVLEQLAEDGLQEDTIVFYFSDHGGSMPRGKSFTYDSGTNVPLLVHIPEKWQSLRPTEAGGVTDRLVSFVDFAPTLLNLVGEEIPDYMQGFPFLGTKDRFPRNYVHTFRGRRGERYDIVRGVRSAEFLYLKNYTPHLPVIQYNGYSFDIPGYLAWQRACESGLASDIQKSWFQPKASEELYRVSDDSDNVKNLADDPEFASVLQAHRKKNEMHILEVRDSVFFPEGMQGRVYANYQDDSIYPLSDLVGLGDLVSAKNPLSVPDFQQAMKSDNPCLRYWGVMGCIVIGDKAKVVSSDLLARLDDEEPLIQLQAARALAGMGMAEDALPTIRKYMDNNSNETLSLRAVLAVDECDLLKSNPEIKRALSKVKGAYAKRIVDKISN